MRRKAALAFLVATGVGLGACSNPYDPGQRAVGGGLLGAGAGAALGGLAGGGRGAALGARVGGGAGARGGAATTPQGVPQQGYYQPQQQGYYNNAPPPGYYEQPRYGY